MHYFQYKRSRLYCENVALEDIAATVGTPFYCYSYRTLVEHFLKLKKAFAPVNPLICFSMKSNSNGAVLRALVKHGAGLDIVSGGELYRGLRAGCAARKIVYAGVGKTEQELEYAMKQGILLFNVESVPELERISRVARRRNVTAQVSLRVNPNVDAHTHAYITTAKAENKFGIDFAAVTEICRHHALFPHVRIAGMHVHIGSQITEAAPFVTAVKKVLAFMERMKKEGIRFTYLNIGGGLGIVYKDETPQTADAFARKLLPLIKKTGYKIILEPGRFISGNSGIFVTRVTYVKHGRKKQFAIVDGGMNDLIRPSLYGSYHAVWPIREPRGPHAFRGDVVGPICESGDFLAKDRELAGIESGALLALMGAGAYGFSMSSTYNSRPRVAEVMVKGRQFAVVRRRETYRDLVRGEIVPTFLK